MTARENENPKEPSAPVQSDNPEGAWLETGWTKFPLHGGCSIERTIRQIENIPCWLLVADIENFTPLSRSLTSDSLATLIGGWVAACKEIIEAHQGMIDKYLGDGFFAYWREDPEAAKNVADALNRL